MMKRTRPLRRRHRTSNTTRRDVASRPRPPAIDERLDAEPTAVRDDAFIQEHVGVVRDGERLHMSPP
ncbi:MAG TPA: hypothetical protein VFC53_10980 [Dehalococcoidia bacterium]|nr:hypothetical protein [Dehalococcoidia bacterium]